MYSGPGGIRTLDLFSAIEARSQLRYRPVQVRIIVPDAYGAVKQTTERKMAYPRSESVQSLKMDDKESKRKAGEGELPA